MAAITDEFLSYIDSRGFSIVFMEVLIGAIEPKRRR
jgi:hypothetical protein